MICPEGALPGVQNKKILLFCTIFDKTLDLQSVFVNIL